MLLALDPQWQSADITNIPRLASHDIHLWWLPLTLSQSKHAIAIHLLSDIQRDRYHRRTPEQRPSYLAGRYYLLTLLGAYTKQQPEDVKLSYTRLNKPYLSHHEFDLHFNFSDASHQGQAYGLFAFCLGREVGVDMESLTRAGQFKRVVEKRFSHAEQQFVTGADGQIIQDRFLALWTRKEASGKATGQGINFKMNQRELVNAQTPDSLEPSFSYYDETRRAWRLTQINLDNRLIACLAHAEHHSLELSCFNQLEKRLKDIP